MATKYRCKACGKEDLTGQNGAKGHVKFSGGDHGDRMELPDNWKALITPMDEGNEGSDQTPNPSDDESDDSPESDEADEQASTPRETTEPTETTGTLSRLKNAITDDVRHLWGGAK